MIQTAEQREHDRAMAELVRLVMWSLVWIVTGGGLGDEPVYRHTADDHDVWRSWSACD